MGLGWCSLSAFTKKLTVTRSHPTYLIVLDCNWLSAVTCISTSGTRTAHLNIVRVSRRAPTCLRACSRQQITKLIRGTVRTNRHLYEVRRVIITGSTATSSVWPFYSYRLPYYTYVLWYLYTTYSNLYRVFLVLRGKFRLLRVESADSQQKVAVDICYLELGLMWAWWVHM